jgi:hypothetical protein
MGARVTQMVSISQSKICNTVTAGIEGEIYSKKRAFGLVLGKVRTLTAHCRYATLYCLLGVSYSEIRRPVGQFLRT